jgi:hypothetical protein
MAIVASVIVSIFAEQIGIEKRAPKRSVLISTFFLEEISEYCGTNKTSSNVKAFELIRFGMKKLYLHFKFLAFYR